jgi:hypothetical protein
VQWADGCMSLAATLRMENRVSLSLAERVPMSNMITLLRGNRDWVYNTSTELRALQRIRVLSWKVRLRCTDRSERTDAVRGQGEPVD